MSPVITGTRKSILLIQGSSKFGGSKQSLLTLSRVLKESGYQPIVACAARGWLTEQLDRAGTRYLLLPFFAWRKWLERFRVKPSIRQRWLPALAPWQFQLVHSNEFWWAPHAVYLGQALGIPSLVHLRDGHHTLKKARQYHLGKATGVIAVSTALREQFAADTDLHRRTRVIFNGHDELAVSFAGGQREARAALGIDPGALVIGNAGIVCERKNQRLLIQVAGKLKQQARLPSFKVVFAGDGDATYLPILRRDIDSLGLQNEVVFLGNVQNIGAFYAAADIIVHCARREGLPRIIPEAMLAKRPVIATEAKGIRDAIPHSRCGRVVAAEDREQLAAAIVELLSDSELRLQLVEEAFAHAQASFSAAAHQSKIDALYQELIRPSGARGTE